MTLFDHLGIPHLSHGNYLLAMALFLTRFYVWKTEFHPDFMFPRNSFQPASNTAATVPVQCKCKGEA